MMNSTTNRLMAREAPDGSVTVSVAGRIDSTNCDAVLAEFLKIDPAKAVILDLNDLVFLSSAGIRVLITLAKRHPNRFSIIRGGENIVPGEIEEAISALDEVLQVYVCGVPDEMMGEKVAAAIVLKSGARFDAKQIRQNLSGRLARHKIPSYLMPLDAFPLLPNGKPDKVQLKKNPHRFQPRGIEKPKPGHSRVL